MSSSKISSKNVQLAQMLSNLRQNIDLHRVIGLNVDQLKKYGVTHSFWGLIQQSAQDEIILLLCKIYEREDQYERNSIPGVINAFQQSEGSDEQRVAVARFGEKYGNTSSCTCFRCHLQETIKLFGESNADTFTRIRKLRNKFGAHSEHGAKSASLPSHERFETLFEFGEDFYRTISNDILDVGPAPIDKRVGIGTLQLMKKLGIENPQLNFMN